MAFVTLSSAAIATGQPVTADLMLKTKNNFDDHDLRITALENGLDNPRPLFFDVKGSYFLYGGLTGIAYQRIWANLTLTAAQLFVPAAGTAGTLDVDILYKRGSGSWTTIFSARPTHAFGAGDLALSTGTLAVTALQAGDVLRLDTIGVETNNLEFQVYLPFTVT